MITRDCMRLPPALDAQHCLYFLPLPHGQVSFLPTIDIELPPATVPTEYRRSRIAADRPLTRLNDPYRAPSTARSKQGLGSQCCYRTVLSARGRAWDQGLLSADRRPVV